MPSIFMKQTQMTLDAGNERISLTAARSRPFGNGRYTLMVEGSPKAMEGGFVELLSAIHGQENAECRINALRTAAESIGDPLRDGLSTAFNRVEMRILALLSIGPMSLSVLYDKAGTLGLGGLKVALSALEIQGLLRAVKNPERTAEYRKAFGYEGTQYDYALSAEGKRVIELLGYSERYRKIAEAIV